MDNWNRGGQLETVITYKMMILLRCFTNDLHSD